MPTDNSINSSEIQGNIPGPSTQNIVHTSIATLSTSQTSTAAVPSQKTKIQTLKGILIFSYFTVTYYMIVF